MTETSVANGNGTDGTIQPERPALAASTPTRPTALASRTDSGFTLVEMLVVMAVIVTMLSLTLPVFKNLLGGRAVEKSITDITSALELGRATAIANRTYVWVLFKNVTNADNNSELRCAVVMSMNGTNYYEPTSNFRAVSKLISLPNVKNVKFSSLPLAVRNVAPADLASDGSYIAGWYENSPGGKSNFKSVVVAGEDFGGSTFVCFDDTGEIGTSADPYHLLVEPKICIGIATTRGTTVQTNATDGAIVAAYGGSGKMRIIRP